MNQYLIGEETLRQARLISFNRQQAILKDGSVEGVKITEFKSTLFCYDLKDVLSSLLNNEIDSHIAFEKLVKFNAKYKIV